MKLTLIYPSGRKANADLQGGKMPKAHRYPGLSLTTVAALTPPGVRIALIDDDKELIDYSRQTDLVGISLLTYSAGRGYEIAGKFRQRGIPVVLGGMHVTACPEEAVNAADSIVIGEAEDTWPALIRDFQGGRLQKVYRSTNSSDLSHLPFPRRELLQKRHYLSINTVQASRGCPFHCEFCSITALFGHKTRFRPLEEVIEEIQSLKGRYFLLNDDNLAQKPDYYKELFRRLIPLRKFWCGEASWNIARDEELIRLMSLSGCRGLDIGFESIEPQPGVVKIMPSENIVSLYKEAIEKLHAHRILVMGNFIFGFDNDRESIFEKTFNFAIEGHLDAAQFTILVPYPGTRLYQRLEAEKRITERNWCRYTTSNLCFRLKNMSERRFLEKFYWIKKKFFTYPRLSERLVRATCRGNRLKELELMLAVNLGGRRNLKSLSAKILRKRLSPRNPENMLYYRFPKADC